MIMRRGECEDEVRAGVAVGYRIDVELVDLVLVSAQSGEAGRAPPAYGVAVETVQHGFEA